MNKHLHLIELQPWVAKNKVSFWGSLLNSFTAVVVVDVDVVDVIVVVVMVEIDIDVVVEVFCSKS